MSKVEEITAQIRKLSDLELVEFRKWYEKFDEQASDQQLEELDGPADAGADRAWLDEIQRRSTEFDAGLVEAIPAEEVFERARARLKQ